ncbi:uncharacterized protein LOC116207356 [Punica granatum]|uniref:Uncharacterized protein LOC116207356 n=1 Tax=Punica granatum TaxID=22663 RepID=A0A6P8DI20_PUNGR|nr:uncharacterized protein LOC116207356 [Punica granatum]
MTANTPSLLQHPKHKHALIFQELSESFSLECNICRLSVKGLAYHCIDCEFFLHKSCAELPPEIQHPSHPQHPLVLSKLCWDSSARTPCYGCPSSLLADYYGCHACKIELHVGCAAATLPPPEEEEHKDEEEMIEHFAHDHPLASFHVDVPNSIKCKACERWISGRVYGCRACIFVLHESCALAPREIMNHPLHPQHPLTLLVDSKPSFLCNVCRCSYSFAYRCKECDLFLDLGCADVFVHPPPRDDQSSTDDRRDQIHHFSHPHQLTRLHVKPELLATCDVPGEVISGDFYGCPDCLFLLHPLRAKLTQEIVHPFHPDHPLIYQPDQEIECSFCFGYEGDIGFECGDCGFGLHAACALQTLSATKEELTLNSERLHKHPMSLDFEAEQLGLGELDIVCCKCPDEGPVYVCTDDVCRAKIHKTCADLERESELPIHPQHPLLLSSEPLNKSNPCVACLESPWGFTFYCDYCKIQFHARCAMRRPTLKHQRHEHSLSYFERIGHELSRSQCNVCYNDCRIDFYRCVPCNYNLHFNCLPLPPSAKHEFHFPSAGAP